MPIDRRTAGIIKATGNLPTAPTADRTAPAAPGVPTQTGWSDFDVTIEFAASASADVAYYVARADGAAQSCGQSAGKEPRITLTGLAPGAHAVVVYAADAAGNFSAASAAGSVSMPYAGDADRGVFVSHGHFIAGGGAEANPGPVWIAGERTFNGIPVRKKRGNKLAVVGDSYDERMGSLSSTSTPVHAIWHQINAQMGHKLEFVHIDGASGTGALKIGSSTTYGNRIDAALAATSDWVALRCSVNDFHDSGNTLAAIIAEYGRLFTLINNSGKGVIANTMPLTSNMDTPTKRANCLLFNQWLLSTLHSSWDGIVLEQHWQTRGVTQNGDPNLSIVSDGTHPDFPGAVLLGATGAAQLNEVISVPGWIEAVQGVSGDADETYFEQNPFNIGTTGTKFANVTGDVPTGKAISAGGGTSVVSSIVPRTDTAGNWCQLVITPSAIGQLQGMTDATAQRYIANGGGQIGDAMQYGVEFEYDAASNGANIGYPFVELRCKNASNADISGGVVSGFGVNSVHPSSIYYPGKRLTVVTPKLIIPATTSYVVLTAKFFNSGKSGESVGAYIGRIGRRMVVNHSR